MIVSLVATVMAVSTLGVTTWLSFRFGNAVRTHEQAALDRYKDMEGHSSQLEQDIASARQRAVTLEQEVSSAQGRAVALEQEISTAKERAAVLEQEASKARERAEALEQAAREASERAARTARENAVAREKAQAPQIDTAEIQRRLADLGKLVRSAAAQAADLSQGNASVAEPSPAQSEGAAASHDETASPIVASLRKFAGTRAAVFVLSPVSDAPAAGSAISAALSDAGWVPETWTWTGVAGIFGVVVLIKDGSDAATSDAGAALVEALRTNGFSATKGDWPADWRRYRGALDGPQTPAPTDASIRIVIGAKPR